MQIKLIYLNIFNLYIDAAYLLPFEHTNKGYYIGCIVSTNNFNYILCINKELSDFFNIVLLKDAHKKR